MRLDKFLKVSRLIKRRPVAKEMADKGRIAVNQKVAKSSTDLKVGDELTITFGNRILRVRVEQLVDTTKKEAAADMYQILTEERVDRQDFN